MSKLEIPGIAAVVDVQVLDDDAAKQREPQSTLFWPLDATFPTVVPSVLRAHAGEMAFLWNSALEAIFTYGRPVVFTSDCPDVVPSRTLIASGPIRIGPYTGPGGTVRACWVPYQVTA